MPKTGELPPNFAAGYPLPRNWRRQMMEKMARAWVGTFWALGTETRRPSHDYAKEFDKLKQLGDRLLRIEGSLRNSSITW